MQTQNKTFDAVDLSRLPILSHYNSDEISKGMKSLNTSQLTIYNITRLAIFGGIGYGLWVYALPAFFLAFGQFAGVAAGILLFVTLFVMRQPIFKGLKMWSRWLDKKLINADPFAELARQKEKMVANKAKFYEAKGKISQLEKQMKIEAANSEQEAKDFQDKMETLKNKAESYREKLTTIADKDSDEYNNALIGSRTTLAEANGMMYRYNQANDLTLKYGSRAKVMGKLNRKLGIVANSMDIKIMDFDNTIFLLQKDYDYAKNSAQATQAAKDTMMFEEAWELTYAMDVVTSTIASDMSMTQMNLKDIDNLTANINIDDDSIFKKLDALTARIGTGEEKVVEAKTFNNIEKDLTTVEKNASGFGDIGL